MATPLLECRGMTKVFGGLQALSDCSLAIREGELLGLIGPNGAGKTTAFNLLTGVLKPSAGRILAGGVELTGAAPETFARHGIARTFQNARLFPELSVLENVMTGLHLRHGASLLQTVLGLPAFRRAEAVIAERAAALLETLGLSALTSSRAGDLAYGDQRRVEIARALALEPRVLLLDEPAAGLNPRESEELVALLRRINGEMSVAVLLVEHDMPLVMGLCRRIQVLNRGELLAEGAPEEIQDNPAVVEAYLGRRRAPRADA